MPASSRVLTGLWRACLASEYLTRHHTCWCACVPCPVKAVLSGFVNCKSACGALFLPSLTDWRPGVQLQHHAVFCNASMEVEDSCTKAPAGSYSAAPCCCYELQNLPGRRLRRWPRLATRDENLKYRSGFFPWPVLQPHRWLWDD